MSEWKGFGILLLLAVSAGRVFSKEQIYEAVWKQEAFNCENAVMCCISQLRKKKKLIHENQSIYRQYEESDISL